MSAWKELERQVGRIINGKRFWGSSGGPIDVESDHLVCQVKHRKTMSLREIEAEAVQIERVGQEKGKAGILCIKRRSGRGCPTPLLFVMTETVWEWLQKGQNRDE